MYHAEKESITLDEDAVSDKADDIVHQAKKHPGRIVMVTNEVGLGIVPENEVARRYRDLVGRCNQIMAAAADEVYLVSCGIPIQIKGKQDAF